ncbi:DsrE/DsrF/DrsH-like family protein [Magnetospira thiophila]
MNAISKKAVPQALRGEPDLEALIDRRVEEKLKELLQKREAERVPRMSIIATKGTLDMAYPPFILASTAAALGWEVSIFFTFYGLELLRSDLDLHISPLGNPAMPMKLPVGPDWLRKINMNIPNSVMAALPGFDGMATSMMKKTLRDKGVASIADLREACLEGEVKLWACQMTVDLFGYDPKIFIPEVAGWIGATSFLEITKGADATIFV